MADAEDKNDPGRFLGEGVSFRAKLIGVLEVPEARGDRMCQEALSDLKMAIRAAGEHKQRIQVHVAIDGLRLRDDKTGDSLYHHPVHKISFIAQDMTDSRAFGYIFGSPDTGHRFFGIKTDKAASQVVIAMRDLFQVVFELKKKEIELAKQQLEGKTISTNITKHIPSFSAEIKSKSLAAVVESSISAKGADVAEGGVAELVDLEQELSSLRRGLTQVEGLTPSTDPFGDSFIVSSQKGLLPPPPSGSSTRGRNTPASTTTSRSVFSPNKTSLPFDLAAATDYDAPPVATGTAPAPVPVVAPSTTTAPNSLVDNLPDSASVSQAGPSASALSYDVFTELDPLGTGRSKPYVDKKLFFQELKNPPKKVLKDLVPTTQSLLSEILPVTSESKTDQYGAPTTMTSLTRHSGGSVAIAKSTGGTIYSGNFFSSDPFAETDPFDSTDPFSESFKDDPFKSMQDFPKQSSLRSDEIRMKISKEIVGEKEASAESEKNVFNGPLQVSLPPEPAPKSPRLQRQKTETSTIRLRPQPSSKLANENASPPPPLPPKKTGELPVVRPPPRPPHDHDELNDIGPPLPKPMRKKEPLADRSNKPRLSSLTMNSSEDEYLTPAPPPLPAARRFDITLTQLLTCSMDELSDRLRVPATTLSSMTLPQLTDYLRSYLAADNDRAHIHIETPTKSEKDNKSLSSIKSISSRLSETLPPKPPSLPTDFKPQFEDNFAPGTESNEIFVANFDDFEKKANSAYDRYAAFREIQEQEKSILDPMDINPIEIIENKQDSDDKEELAEIEDLRATKEEIKELSKSPMKSLDELTLDSFNMFRSSVSPKPSQVEAKIEDIKSVMKSLQIEKCRRSVSPRECNVEAKHDDRQSANDRYAALREIIIKEPPDEFESLPPDLPKERKRSDEKSDGFDNSDFFDCIDNSSLSFTHVDDAFRKSPSVKEKEEEKKIEVKETQEPPSKELKPPALARLSTGSISDIVSGSSPEAKDKSVCGVSGGRAGPGAGRWSVLGAGASPWSSDSRESRDSPPACEWRPPHAQHVQHAQHAARTRRRAHHSPHASRGTMVQTSSSSRDVSPWEEEPPPVTRLQRAPAHRDRESRHNSSGSRECLDSGSGREKDKIRDKRDTRERDRDLSRDSRESGSTRDRDRRDSGSGRDRRDVSKDRDHRDRRDRRSRERENETWDRDRAYSTREREYRDSRSRERPKEYRDKERTVHRKPRHSYDEDEDYSDECGSGRSSPRERWSEHRWRRDERNYGSLGWRETRRRNELRQNEDPSDRRFGSTLGWPGRRSGGNASRRDARDSRDIRDTREVRDARDARDARDVRDARDPRDARRRTRREEPRRPRDYRFSNDFSPRDREHPSPFDNDFQDTPTPTSKKRGPYSSLEGTRFAFDPEETAASPVSGSSARARDGDSPATRFRFDSDSLSPRSMFEDDFTALSAPRGRTASIAEEDEADVPPLRTKPQSANRDIKKSESVNIFTRETDPFENDDFFACTGSDRAARRENWPGDFQGFDNA